MFTRANLNISRSDGERSLFLAFLGVALFGAGLSFTIVNKLGGEAEFLRKLTMYDYWVILAGALGAAGGLFIGKDRLGHDGWDGAGRAALGMVVVTFAATVCAGTLALPGYGTMFGPFATVLAFWETPILLAFWVIVLTACHLLILTWRRERHTLFAIHDDGIPI